MGWDGLQHWGNSVLRREKLAGGMANDVWSLSLDGRLAVGRLGRRSDADLQWEADLLVYLASQGMTVPVPIPTKDGRLFVDGLVVMDYVEGGPPETADDWQRVADTLRHLHRLTADWPQRPGWRGSLDLLTEDRGTRIDLTAMPVDAVPRCRAAWARLAGWPTSVTHGDPNPRNIRMTASHVGLIDWDEAHVDVSALDLDLPDNPARFAAEDFDMIQQASAAWEAAVCWKDDYAERRLAEVRAV